MNATALNLQDVGSETIHSLLKKYNLTFIEMAPDQAIPGSYWGETEAGIIGLQVYARPNTPIHSILHESCHIVCMDQQRRESLHTDAGGETSEEDAVCYLQILLADHIPGMGKARMWQDMDNWGYTFRLGSAQHWFEQDAEEAKQWLINHGLINPQQQAIFRLRQY